MPDAPADHPQKLPEVRLTAAGSGREVNLRDIGVPAILVFHGQDTVPAAVEVHKVVRKIYPTVDEVFLASVIDLRAFPSMFRNMVQPALEKAYFHEAGKIPAGADPADLVVLLPDWDGAVHDSLGVTDSTEKAAVIVADGQGLIICRDQSTALAETALKVIQELNAS
jgi:hypothetical protein